jgi:cytochrome c-type biogenesis protein CcsB
MLRLQTLSVFAIFACSLAAFIGYLLQPGQAAERKVRWPLWLILLGFLLQTGYLALRWRQAGYLPVASFFSTQFFFSWSLTGVFLYFELRYRLAAGGLCVLLVNLLLLASVMPANPALPPRFPALDTPLFTLHVALSFLAYAFFTMAFTLGGLYLLQRHRLRSWLPEPLLLGRLNEEAVFLGFCLFTLGLVLGCIWAYLAWGSYFSWNVKSLWSFIIWLFYAGMCHAKFIRRWQGAGYALLSIAGFGVVLFTYLGIGLLLKSNHPLS